METNEIVAYPRVTSEVIKEFVYRGMPIPGDVGEVVEIRAMGTWGEFAFPVSVHLTVPPGCAVTPFMGDCLKIMVGRDDRSVEEIERARSRVGEVARIVADAVAENSRRIKDEANAPRRP